MWHQFGPEDLDEVVELYQERCSKEHVVIPVLGIPASALRTFARETFGRKGCYGPHSTVWRDASGKLISFYIGIDWCDWVAEHDEKVHDDPDVQLWLSLYGSLERHFASHYRFNRGECYYGLMAATVGGGKAFPSMVKHVMTKLVDLGYKFYFGVASHPAVQAEAKGRHNLSSSSQELRWVLWADQKDERLRRITRTRGLCASLFALPQPQSQIALSDRVKSKF